MGTNNNCVVVVEGLTLMEGFRLGCEAGLVLVEGFIGLCCEWVHTLA